MIVVAKVALPADTQVEITIHATLGDLGQLHAELRRDAGYSYLGGLLAQAITDAAIRLRASIESPIEKTKESPL